VEIHVAGSRIPSERDDIRADVDHLIADPALTDRVILHGQLDQASLRQLMSTVDVFALPSYREGVPRSVIEAMAAHRPVIATSIRGCRELVEPGLSGWLVPPRVRPRRKS
jgi:glycosyltransferase involved in cell wall biosynthesis